MASAIALTHPSGLRQRAYVGFSWTSLFFGPMPATFRGDWLAFFVYLALGVVFFFGIPILWLVWPFFYNRWHARRLVEKGYRIEAANDIEAARRRVLG